MRKEGFTYIYSETLKQEIALSQKTGILYCADGTKYSKEELSLIAGTQVPLEAHILKKVFGGTIAFAETLGGRK